MALGGIVGAALKGSFGSLFGGNSVWSNSEYAQILEGEPDDALYREYKKVSTTPQYFYRAPIAKKELEKRGINPNTGMKNFSNQKTSRGSAPFQNSMNSMSQNTSSQMASVTKNPISLIVIVGAILAFLNLKK